MRSNKEKQHENNEGGESACHRSKLGRAGWNVGTLVEGSRAGEGISVRILYT